MPDHRDAVLTTRMRDSSLTAQRLRACLEDLVTEPVQRREDIVRRSTRVGSSPSWHSQAAYLVLELRQLARGSELGLRLRVSGSQQVRGGSDRNTTLALQALPDLVAGVRGEEDEEWAWQVWHQLDHWCCRAQLVLGEVEPLTRLPRLPGQEEARCPWCRCRTLRYQRQAGLVRCVNPSCEDDTQQRPLARVELGRLSGEPLLVWRDGAVGVVAA